ncbi:protein of unknown function [Cyanobium sp. NIES-981]|nr:protein of unknown function [Cyanobium sp. NIES-981]
MFRDPSQVWRKRFGRFKFPIQVSFCQLVFGLLDCFSLSLKPS